MALNYEVKKRVFGFDETKTEKYVAQMKTLGVVGFKDLCDEVSKIGHGASRCGEVGAGRIDRHLEYGYQQGIFGTAG